MTQDLITFKFMAPTIQNRNKKRIKVLTLIVLVNSSKGQIIGQKNQNILDTDERRLKQQLNLSVCFWRNFS